MLIPKRLKERAADDSIQMGCVIRCFITQTKPPKEKRFIVLGKDTDNNYIGIVLINSNLNFKVMNNQELWNLQYPIKGKDNDYLEWDSFVDCSQLIKLEYEYVKNKIIEKPNAVLGNVKKTDLDIIITLIKSSSNISPVELKNIGLL